ncbi:MAG: hypothetical protein IKD81_03370 [Eubacteriaceae bacterium]|nr:hypothetical protein [Eubacteriaceae bacterium]
MKKISIKFFSVLVTVMLVCCSLPSIAMAYNQGTVTLIIGESARAANVTFTRANRYPNSPALTPGGAGKAEVVTETSVIIYKDPSIEPDSIRIYFDKTDDLIDGTVTFVGWKVQKDDETPYFLGEDDYPYYASGWETLLDMEQQYEPYLNSKMYLIPEDKYSDTTYSGVTFDKLNSACSYWEDSNWTIEPIFTVNTPTPSSPYTFQLLNEGDEEVDKGEEVELDLHVYGEAYDGISAKIQYDADLFEFTGFTPGAETPAAAGIQVDEVDVASPGTLEVSGTSLGKTGDIDDVVLTLKFKAKAVAQEKTGVFSVKSASAVTSAAAVSSDAIEGAPGPDVSVLVNAAEFVTVTYPNGDTEDVESGSTVTFTLSEKYTDYESTGYTYTVTAGSFEVVDNQDGTYTIKNVASDVTVEVKKNPQGTLSTYDLKISDDVTFKVAKFIGDPGSGKTFFYEDVPMIKTDDGYLFIIGTDGTALASKITIGEAQEEIVMKASGDVNQTGIIDISDAQLISDIYNGTYTDGFATVAMVKYLAADTNNDGEIDVADIAYVVALPDFKY